MAFLNLNTIHKCFLPPPPQKVELNAMLHRIQISTCNHDVITMQVKRAIGKATMHKLSIYNEYMCLC